MKSYMWYLPLFPSLSLFHLCWVLLTQPRELLSQWTLELLRTLPPVPQVTASAAWSPGDAKAMPCLELLCLPGLHSMKVCQSGIGIYSCVLEDLGENRSFFIFLFIASSFHGRDSSPDMSPEGTEETEPSSNTPPFWELAFPSDAWSPHFLWDEFYPRCSSVPCANGGLVGLAPSSQQTCPEGFQSNIKL